MSAEMSHKAFAKLLASWASSPEFSGMIVRIVEQEAMPHNGWRDFDAETGRTIRLAVERILDDPEIPEPTDSERLRGAR